MPSEAAQRAVVLYVLDHERTAADLERIVGPEAGEATRALAAARVVVHHGERIWASPGTLRLDELGLIAV
jgi:hypothetical protein